MLYQFIDNYGTFRVKDPQKYNLYFPLTNRRGSILSSISPNLAGDIKKDNERFLTPPATIEDLRSNFLCRRDFFIQTGKQILRASLPYNDLLEIGFLYHKVTKNTGNLVIEITNFVPYDSEVEVMHVKVRNIFSKPVKISPVSFIPLYGRSEKNLRDHRHVSSLLNRIEIEKYGISLKPTMIFDEKQHKINEDIYFVFGFDGNFTAPLGQYP
ncbi:cellobiose phosphorylase, partial [bacterium]